MKQIKQPVFDDEDEENGYEKDDNVDYDEDQGLVYGDSYADDDAPPR